MFLAFLVPSSSSPTPTHWSPQQWTWPGRDGDRGRGRSRSRGRADLFQGQGQPWAVGASCPWSPPHSQMTVLLLVGAAAPLGAMAWKSPWMEGHNCPLLGPQSKGGPPTMGTPHLPAALGSGWHWDKCKTKEEIDNRKFSFIRSQFYY